jgi:hypothetical protein
VSILYQGQVFCIKTNIKMKFVCTLWIIFLLAADLIGTLSAQLLESSVWVDPPPKYTCPKQLLYYPCECLKGSEDGIYVQCNNTNIASLSVGLRQIKTLVHTLTIGIDTFLFGVVQCFLIGGRYLFPGHGYFGDPL